MSSIRISAQADFSCCTAFHCSSVNNWYCELLAEGKAPNGHSESNKIFAFTANFTFKRFPLSHFGIKFQLNSEVKDGGIKSQSISS